MANAQCSHTSALQLHIHSSERLTDVRNDVCCMLHVLPSATAYVATAHSRFRCRQTSWAGAPRTRPHPVWHANKSLHDHPTPPRPLPAPSLARMQQLQPLPCCSKKIAMVLVADRVQTAPARGANTLARHRWQAQRKPETLLTIA